MQTTGTVFAFSSIMAICFHDKTLRVGLYDLIWAGKIMSKTLVRRPYLFRLRENVMRALVRTHHRRDGGKFGPDLVPVEEVVRNEERPKKVSGAVLPRLCAGRMEMDDDSGTWSRTRRRSPVSSAAPPQTDADFERRPKKIMQQMQEGVEKPVPRCCSRSAKWCASSRAAPSPTFNGSVEEVNTKEPPARVGDDFGRARRWNWNSAQVEKA